MLILRLCIVIGLLAISAPMFSLAHFSAEGQTIPIPEFAPKAPETPADGGDQIQQQPEAEPEPPRATDFAMKVQLEPHENEFLADDGYYQVSDFAITISNSSELCPSGDCDFELDGGEVTSEFTPGERALSGKLKVSSGDSTRILNVYSDWETIEEREVNGETLKIIGGSFGAGRDEFNPENQYQINGTLASDGDDLIMEVHGGK